MLRVASAVITPSVPDQLAGYAARGAAVSTGTHDDLEAALLVLDDGATSVGWLTLDAIGVTVELADTLRSAVATHLPGTAVMICASHTHSAPLGWTGPLRPGGSGTPDPERLAELVARVSVLAAEVAAQAPALVEAGWDAVELDGVGANRHDPAGPHERTLGLLTLRDTDGTVRAVLADFATHPTVLGPDNLEWSADWPGAFRARLRERLGAPVLFLQGAAGDVSPRFTRRAATFEEAARLGGLAAEAAERAVSGHRSAAPQPPGTPRGFGSSNAHLRVRSATLALERRTLPTLAEADAEVRAASAAIPAGEPGDPAVRIAQTRLDGARVQRDLVAASDSAAPIDVPVAVVALGPIAWTHLPVEPFASIGAAISAGSPTPITRVVGYSNGYFGYLVDDASTGSYEALSTPFAADAADQITSTAHRLLEETAMPYDYPRIAHETIDRITATQLPAIDAAVDLIAGRLRSGGILHVFGTGHARIPMHEMAGRAGGLLPINLVRMSDLAFRGDLAAGDLLDPLLERDPSFAAAVLELSGARDGDVFLIASNSGINGVVVEFATLVRDLGIPIVAITSIAHSTSVASRHSSGKRLLDLAGIVIDNGAPPGDAALDLGGGVAVGAVSNLAGVVIVQLLTEGIARHYLAEGDTPPVYRSMNLPDGDDRNADLLAAVAGRVHPIEP